MSYDLTQVNSVYDDLTGKIKADLDNQYNMGRLTGSDYANVYAQLMGQCMQLAFQSPVNDKQVQLYDRQKQGFDDKMKMDLFQAQISSWASMFASGMLTDKPSVIANDEVSALYNDMKSELNIT